MKVYVAKIHYDCEGYDIVGIFRTREEAEDSFNNPDLYSGDDRTVDEYVLGEVDEKSVCF